MRPSLNSKSQIPNSKIQSHPVLFSKVAILGLGLIGGSIALEIKKQRLAREVVGYNRSRKGRVVAIHRKACDQVFSDPLKAVQGADLIILAVPVLKIPELAQRIKKGLKAGAIVTDVGSTKSGLTQKLLKILPKQVYFLGGHPIAGTENVGMESAELGLFQDRWWIFTPTTKKSKLSNRLVPLKKLIEKFGAKVAIMSPAQHDQVFSIVSHLPHMLAFSLIQTVSGESPSLRFAGTSFKDLTRVAASSGQMWAEICRDNQKSIVQQMQRFEKKFSMLKKMVSQGKVGELEKFFNQAAQIRRGIS